MPVSVGSSTKRYVSAISLLDKREIAKGVFDINHEDDFLNVMESLGRMVKTDLAQFHLYTKDPINVIGVVNGVPSGSGTTTVTVTLSAGTSGYGTVNTLVRFPNGGVGRIDSITSTAPDIYIIKSVNTSVLTVLDTNKLSFFSNAQGEGSGSPAARRFSQTKYANQIQIFKDKADITDVQMGSTIETVGPDGNNYWTSQAIADTYLSFRKQIALGHILNVPSATLFSDAAPVTIDASGNPIQTSRGLDSYASTFGVSDTLTTPGTVVLADLTDLVNQIKAVRGPSKYWGWSGTAPKLAYDVMLKNLGSANMQWSKRYTDNGKDVDFGVDSFTHGNVEFNFKTFEIFDDPTTINLSGLSDVYKSMYFVPDGKIQTMAGDKVDRLRVRYMKVGGTGDKGSSIYSEVHTGKYADSPTDDYSGLRVHYETKQGLEIAGATQLVKQVVLA